MVIVVNKNAMKLTSGQYALILCCQTFLFWCDFALNAFSTLAKSNAGLLILFIIQDVCIVLSISSLLLTFFSTYVFRAGLVEFLYSRFKCTLVVCILYFILTTVLHVWSLASRWNGPEDQKDWWSVELLIVFVTQRIWSPFYYYFFKRTALRISDPRFYVDAWDDKSLADGNSQYQCQECGVGNY